MNELTTLNNRGYARVPAQASITKLLIFETGEYNQQWSRPYTTNFDSHVLNQFHEQLNGVEHFSPAGLTGIAQSFIKPAAQVNMQTDGIPIPQGWGERRCRFMMIVEYDGYLGTRMQQVLTGYTTHVGAMPSGGILHNEAQLLAVDHELLFFVNSSIQLQVKQEFGPGGRRESIAVAKNAHVLADNTFGSIFTPEHQERMRPTDLFAVMSRSHIHQLRDDQGNIPGVGPRLFDGRNANSNMAALSLRGNVIPASYVARVLDNYQNAAVTNNDPTKANTDFYTNARQYSNDGLVSNDEVLRMISDLRGEPIGNTFKFRDIVRLDPTIEHRVMGRASGRTEKMQGLHQVGVTNEWYGRDPITHAATIISQCTPGIMADLALTRFHFKMHNEMAVSGNYSSVDAQTWMSRPGYQPDMAILNCAGFGDQDLAPAMYAFEKRFWFEVMKDLCFDNQIRFMIEVNADLMGETVVNISLDGRQLEQFVTPSFADALLTPLVTKNHSHVVQVAEDFNELIKAVVHVDHSEHAQHLFDNNLF